MKARGFLLTRRARQDLEEIGTYIASESPARALSFLDELLHVCREISDFPAKGRVPPEIRHMKRTDIREIIHGNYRIVYRIQKRRVAVLHIFNAARLFRMRDLQETEE